MSDIINNPKKLKKPGNMEISILCHQMAIVLKSGIGPTEGIPLIEQDIADPNIKASLASISEKVAAGIPVYQAFSLAQIYPSYMVHMIEVGEKTGMLETVMENLSIYYETEADIKKRIKNAIAYPSVLAVLMLGVIALLIFKVIPMFGEILESLGGQMPDDARILFSFATNMKTIFAWSILIIVVLVIAFLLITKTDKGRMMFDRVKLNNPLSGSIYKKIIASRISQGLSLTIQSGMNVIEGFDLLLELTENRYVKERMKNSSEKIKNGVPLTEVLKEMRVFPELFIRMVRSGERTGNLQSMITKISTVYAKESELAFKRLGNTIEPVLVTILSVILGIVLLSVLIPLIGMMSSIG